jgi:hypothetical protein
MTHARILFFLRTALILLSGFALYGALNLSLAEWRTPGFCPSAFGVPICYVVTSAYFLIFLSAWMSFSFFSESLFFLGSLMATSLALIGTFMQFSSRTECPKMMGGFPLCYVSLGLVFLLIALNLIFLKMRK